jgi:SpoIID/LytB domain protein
VIEPEELAQALASRTAMQTVTEMRVLDRAASGHIKRLLISGQPVKPEDSNNNPLPPGTQPLPSSIVLDGDSQIRAMLSGRLGSTTALPSSTFVVLPRRDKEGKLTAFVLKGAGWGHGAGMCQRGAQNRAAAGWNARQIINFYFRGVEVRKFPG